MQRQTLRAALTGALTVACLLPAAAAQEESEPGKIAFNNACRTCHSFKAGDNRLGPSLHGVVGRKAGSLQGFQFSPAMKDSGITWDQASLDKFITNPETVVHGNKMQPFGGVADASERAKIVDFLKTLTD